eukprot:COSAG02_NODE_27145_length_616_cov_0.818182_1_plen_47_part_10
MSGTSAARTTGAPPLFHICFCFRTAANIMWGFPCTELRDHVISKDLM